MTFFPFGIPSTASFAETAQRARDLYTPSYSALHANVARKAPPGSPAAQATDAGCPAGYTSAIQPTPGYVPVPSNDNVDRSGYILCFQLPPTPSTTPTPSVTPPFPSLTPTPTPSATLPPVEVCDESTIAVASGITCSTPNPQQSDTLYVSSFNNYYLGTECTFPASGDYYLLGSPTSPGYYSCSGGTCAYTSC